MIILITGSSHVGKTYLAQKLLEKYKYPYLSIDHLKMGLIRSNNTKLTPEDDGKLTDYLWPIVLGMIKTAIENKQNMIIEGCYIPANWEEGIEEEYLKSIKLVCLAFSDKYIDNHFDDIKKNSQVIEARLYDDCDIAIIKEDNRKYISEFSKDKNSVYIIDTDYEKTINEIIKQI